MCAAFTLKCLAYEVYVLGSNEQSYLLFSSLLIHQQHAYSPADSPPHEQLDGRARRQQLGIISFFLSFIASNWTKTTKIVCDPATRPHNHKSPISATFRPHSRALQFQYFITAVECYRNSLESDRAPFTVPSTVLHRDRASRSNGTILPLSEKQSV